MRILYYTSQPLINKYVNSVMVFNVHRNHTEAYQLGMGGRGYGGRLGKSLGEGDNTYRYTVTTRMIPALRWAAMRAILMFHDCEGQSLDRQCPQTTNFEEKGEPKRYRTEVLTAYQPTALPLGQTGSQNKF